jgi:hypothetical protein
MGLFYGNNNEQEGRRHHPNPELSPADISYIPYIELRYYSANCKNYFQSTMCSTSTYSVPQEK